MMLAAPLTSGLVMVIDDDADIRDVIRTILQLAGYDVLTACDGADALSKLTGQGLLPGVILLDLRMPVMDGHQFREAQLRDPRLAAVPVVVMSGDANVADTARDLYAESVIQKPVQMSRLLAEVSRFCRAP